MNIPGSLSLRSIRLALGLMCLLAGFQVAPGQTPDVLWSRQDSGGNRSVDFSPDGDLVAYSATSGQSILVRRAANGALVTSLRSVSSEYGGVDQLAFAPGGLTLASTWNRTTIVSPYTFWTGGLEIWPAYSPPPISTAGTRAGYVGCLAWAPDAASIASGGAAGVILWNALTGEKIRSFVHGTTVLSVAFSPDGRFIASGATDNLIRIWRVSDGTLVRTLAGHTDYVRAVEFSPDGVTLASGAGGFNAPDDHTIKIWRVSDGALLRTFSGHTDWVLDLTFALNGTVLGSASRDGTIRYWRTADGTQLLRYDFGGALPISLDVAPDNQVFAYALNTGTVAVARQPALNGSAPVPTLVSAEPGDEQVTLTWSDEHTADPAVIGYAIYYDVAGAGQRITTVGRTTTYVDSGLTNGITYLYKVTSRYADRESAYSNVLWAVPIKPGQTLSGVSALETGRYETTGRGRNKTTSFVNTSLLIIGDEVVFRAHVEDVATKLPLQGAVVDLEISGPQPMLLVTAPSDAGGIAEARWKTVAAKKNKTGGTPGGRYTVAVKNVTALGYTWDEAAKSVMFSLY